MATDTIVIPGNGTGTISVQLHGPDITDVEAVLAEIDTAGAGDTIATLTATSPTGNDVAAVPQGAPVSGGGQGRATWALRLAEEGGGGGGGSLKVTDGVTTVNPASELDIGGGLVLANLGGGRAGLTSPQVRATACRWLQADGIGHCASTTLFDVPGALPGHGWNLSGQWTGRTNDRLGIPGTFDAATEPTWTGEAFTVTQNGGELAIQPAATCPPGLLFYSIAANVYSFDADPAPVTEMRMGATVIAYQANPNGLDEMAIGRGFWGQFGNSWPLSAIENFGGGLVAGFQNFTQNAGALIVPIAGGAQVLRPDVMQTSGVGLQVLVTMRLALLHNFRLP